MTGEPTVAEQAAIMDRAVVRFYSEHDEKLATMTWGRPAFKPSDDPKTWLLCDDPEALVHTRGTLRYAKIQLEHADNAMVMRCGVVGDMSVPFRFPNLDVEVGDVLRFDPPLALEFQQMDTSELVKKTLSALPEMQLKAEAQVRHNGVIVRGDPDDENEDE